jgi:hypothetical protein
LSTQLALGIVGAGIGYFFGSPQLGFVIGSMIGGLLDPPKSEGPRLQEKKLQNSTYGAMIPYFWGSGRIAGVVIDQTDLEEHKEKSSGKGGPEVTNYTYSASFDILLGGARVFGEPAILGVLKIWADGRLIWDINASEEACPFVVYNGTEDQLPDPTFEAIHGVGEVPAYRGYAHVVATDFYLTDFGNRIPSFEFLVYTGTGGDYPTQISVATLPFEPGYATDSVTLNDGRITVTLHGTPSGGTTPIVWKQYDQEWNQIGLTSINNIPGSPIGFTIDSDKYLFIDGSSNYSWWIPNPVGIYVQSVDVTTDILAHGRPAANFNVSMDGFLYGLQGTAPFYLHKWIDGGDFVAKVSVGSQNKNNVDIGTSDNGHVWLIAYESSLAEMWEYDSDLNLLNHWDDAAIAGTAIANTGAGGNFFVYRNQIAFNKTVGAVHTVALITVDPASHALTDDLEHFLAQGNSGRLSHLIGGQVMNINYGIFSLEAPAGAVKLSKIVGDLTDMTPAVGMYDAAELVDDVRWFIIASQMTVRNAIQALRQVFFFDAVESDDLLKYRKRSEVSTFEIPDDDLCGRSYGAESGEPLRTIRTREQELPRTVTITYIDVDRDYQIGTQSTPRQTTLSEQDTTVQVPVGLNTDEAMQKCWTLINGAWIEREHFEWSTTRKWAHLEPCDVGLVRGRVIRIQTRVEAPDGVIRWTGVLAAPSIYTNEDSSIYIQPGTGAPGDGWIPPSPPRAIVATKLVLLDIPLLQETDYPNGFYAAVGPAAVGRWPGAEVYKSVDGGSTYTSVGGSLVSDTIGLATSTLGNWTGGNNFDETNHLDVAIDDPDNELVSVSEEAVLNGANRFAIGSASAGWEVAQFKTATLLSAGHYRLTGFLRGRYGTEWAIPGHAAAETFVLLPTSININRPAADLGTARKYKAVTLGQPLADAAPVDFYNVGVAVIPYSPVLVEGGRNAAGDITINWARRTRIGGVWLESVEVPLSEPVEKYRITFYTTAFGAAVSYFEVTAATTVTYSAIAQGVDFGSLQNPLYVGVRQWGQYGLGYEGRATI